MSEDDHSDHCPLAVVDRRLEDVHRQWHEAEAAYFEPESFRRLLQTAIQTLRTVTFIVQSHKALIPDFASWYQEWQDRLRSDPLMRWMIDARNKIEKQGDLEIHSVVRAEIIASNLDDGLRHEVAAKLFDGVSELLKSIPDNQLGAHIRKHGTLRIERRWVENSLPQHELLDATAIAYGRISELVKSAHEQMGLAPPTTTDTATGQQYAEGDRAGRLPCMIAHDDFRTFNFALADGAKVSFEEHEIPFDLEAARKHAEKHGLEPEQIFAEGGNDPVSHLRALFETARSMMVGDGYHNTIAFMLVGGVPCDIMQFVTFERSQGYLMARKLAARAAQTGADAVIQLGEMWSARFDPKEPYQRPAEAPDRREFLSGTLVRKEGDAVQLLAEIIRTDGGIELGETIETEHATLFAFAQVYKNWGKSLPNSDGPEATSDGLGNV